MKMINDIVNVLYLSLEKGQFLVHILVIRVFIYYSTTLDSLKFWKKKLKIITNKPTSQFPRKYVCRSYLYCISRYLRYSYTVTTPYYIIPNIVRGHKCTQIIINQCLYIRSRQFITENGCNSMYTKIYYDVDFVHT